MAGIELYAPRTAHHRRTWTAAAVVLAVVFILLGQLMTVFSGMALGISFAGGMPADWQGLTYILLGFGFSVILLWLWLRFFERRGLVEIGFNADGLRRYGRGLLLGFGFLVVVVGLIWALGGYTVESLGVWQAPAIALFLPLAALFLGFVVQGATEEIFMRGWLLQVIASRHGIILGIVINSLVFSLLHAGNIKWSPELAVGLANIVLVAIFLSFYAVKEGSLWGVCAWHSAWNWLLGVGFGLEVSGEKIDVAPIVIDLIPQASAPWWLTGASFGPEGSLITTAVLAAGVAYQVVKGALKPQSGYPVTLPEADAQPVQTPSA